RATSPQIPDWTGWLGLRRLIELSCPDRARIDGVSRWNEKADLRREDSAFAELQSFDGLEAQIGGRPCRRLARWHRSQQSAWMSGTASRTCARSMSVARSWTSRGSRRGRRI